MLSTINLTQIIEHIWHTEVCKQNDNGIYHEITRKTFTGANLEETSQLIFTNNHTQTVKKPVHLYVTLL
jgi:hypothetical protein